MRQRPSLTAVLATVGTVLAVTLLVGGILWDRHRVQDAGEHASQPDPSVPTTTAPTSSPVPRSGQTLAVIGDSYSQAPGTDRQTWWQQVASRHGMTPKGDPVGGTGYCAGGERAFKSQTAGVLAEPVKLIVVAGSRNDVNCPGEVHSAATEVLTAIRDASRGAKIIVVGPMWDSSTPSAAARQADAGTRQAAQQLGLPYVDGLDAAWLSGHPELIDTDGVHPTPAGVDVLSRGIDEALTQAGAFA